MRSKLEGRYATFVQAKEKEALLAGLQDAEDWLYSEEGEDATKSAYVQKLDALKVMGDPIVLRWKESEERPKAAAALREEINTYLTMAQSGDDKYSHIDEADKTKVVSNVPAQHELFIPSRDCSTPYSYDRDCAAQCTCDRTPALTPVSD
jgi:heat shock protein 4